MMKKKVSLWMMTLLLLLCMTGCGSAQGGDSTDSQGEEEQKVEEDDMSQYDSQVKVMSYNIYYKNVTDERATNIWNLVKENDPDVLILEEVSTDWVPYVKQFMEENGYSYYGYGRYGAELSDETMDSSEQFVPVLWKTEKYDLIESGHFWLSSTPDAYSAGWDDGVVSKYPRCENWVILQDKETGGKFFALPVHTDPESNTVRTKSSQLIIDKMEELAGDLPIIMGGDWNMGMTENAYQMMIDAGYINVRTIAKTTTSKGSFNDWGARSDDDYLFLDHIFVSDNVGVESYEVLDDLCDGEHISDHCPIQAVIYY